MAEVFCEVAGKSPTHLRVLVPNKGAWYADAELGEAVSLSGRVEITLGSLKLSGTVDPEHSGVFGQTTRVRVLAGAGGWGKPVKPKAYHNDARVKAKTIAEDAAREVGETIGAFLPAAERVGVDFVRAEPAFPTAALALEAAIGAVPWWVGFDGKTNVGPRSAATPGTHELLAFDPATHVATIGVDDPAAVGIGATLEDARLGGAQVVRQLEIAVESKELRIRAWCSADGSAEARIVRAIEDMARHATGGKLFGLWRYRVVAMSGDKVELQAVSKAAGLPDVLPVEMHPGLAGAHSELTGGTEVLIQFVEGSVTMPVLTAFGGREVTGATPGKTTIGATSELTINAAAVKLGTGAAQGVARLSDTVTVLLPPANIAAALAIGSVIMPNGAPNPAPIQLTGTVIWPTQTTGQISVASNKVSAE